MLKSMTGYGEARHETERFIVSVELRSVNNRFFKMSVKVPEEISFVQSQLEEQVRKRVDRGSVHMTLRFEPTASSDLYEIDGEVLKKYLHSLDGLQTDLQLEQNVTLKDLLPLPGVVRSRESLLPDGEAIQPIVNKVLDDSLSQLLSMRQLEGAKLEDDLRERSTLLKKLLAQIRQEAPRAVEEYQQKLDQRVRTLLGDQQGVLAPEDLLKEVAILAERSDITEEIERMDSHIGQFTETLKSGQPVGRKLEFIVQEMFRESNTMGSKSPSSDLNRLIVDVKAEVDRIKEQVLNIE